MIVKVSPSTLKGKIAAPASKSSMQRACAAALIRTGTSIIKNAGNSNDDKAAIEVIQKLGAEVLINDEQSIQIISRGVVPVSDQLDCGESGLGIRMFTPIAAISSREISITGKGSLVTRPMNFFDEIFPKLSIAIKSNKGKLPLEIKGPLKPSDITIDGSLSSQFLTGLLMAYSATITEPVTISVTNLKSKPYIDLTLDVLQKFGLNVPVHNRYETFHFTPAKTSGATITYTVEGDWSGAAFLLVAGAIAGPVEVTGLDITSSQADKAILQALKNCGCMMSVSGNIIHIGPANLQAFEFDATDCPDLFPPLVALAAYCNGTTSIKGVTRLKHKESDRAITLQKEFKKLGIDIILNEDIMLVEGGSISPATIYSHHDHRIAMACAVAALKASGEVVIEAAEAIDKSYPSFYEDINKLGGSIIEASE